MKVTFDTLIPEEVAEVKSLLGLTETLAEDESPTSKPEKKPVPKKRIAKPTPAAKPEPEPEPEEEEPETRETEAEPSGEEEESGVTIDHLRELLDQKVGAHRNEIVAKLKAVGAKSVSTLDESKYAEMKEFFESL